MRSENNKNELLGHLLDGETKIFKLLTDLKYEREETLHDIMILKLKSIKLKSSSLQIDRINNSLLQRFIYAVVKIT